METLLRREFVVNISPEKAWDHLVRVEQWPSWAKHIKEVDLTPPGPAGPHTTGVFHLADGVKAAFTMTEFDPPNHWKWVGPFLRMAVYYDHVFEAIEPGKTRISMIVEAEGLGVDTVGKLFARLYEQNLELAIPLLVEEMHRT